MSESSRQGLSRRDLMKNTGMAAAAATLAGMIPSGVHAAEDSTLQVALVGCGGRGTGAAANALSVGGGPIKLVAMADVFKDRLDASYSAIHGSHADKTDVPEERRFVGFDAYKHAMDALKPGDIVILATPVAFRWPQFAYAIEKGLHVFMEKPVTADGPTSRKMLELGEASKAKNLKVGVGLMCRHCDARGELHDRIQNGEIGDIILMRAYRIVGPTASAFSNRKPDNVSEMEYQIRRFHSFLWASGGAVSDFLIHNLDECCWMKNAFPVAAQAVGGRHYRNDYVDQNFDSYGIEYTFADGSKLMLDGRTMDGCHNEFASYAHGSKGSAIISTSGHAPARPRIFKGQAMTKENEVWKYGREGNPYQLEWDHLVAAIREDKPFNEVQRGVEASVATSMGRMAAHTGQVITFDQMLNCDHEFAPGIDKFASMDDTPPVTADANGHYPVPMPGIIRDREY